jgi:hypothetical protein
MKFDQLYPTHGNLPWRVVSENPVAANAGVNTVDGKFLSGGKETPQNYAEFRRMMTLGSSAVLRLAPLSAELKHVLHSCEKRLFREAQTPSVGSVKIHGVASPAVGFRVVAMDFTRFRCRHCEWRRLSFPVAKSLRKIPFAVALLAPCALQTLSRAFLSSCLAACAVEELGLWPWGENVAPPARSDGTRPIRFIPC